MQASSELNIDDFEVIEDSPITHEDLLETGEDFFSVEKALTAREFITACEKTIATCHLDKTKAEYRYSFNCFGKPTDENVSLILLNILCADTGNGKNSRKHDLLRRIDCLPKCKTDKESAMRIEQKIEALKKSVYIEDMTIFATIRLTHHEGKNPTHSTLYIDKRQLTGKKLTQAIKAYKCSEEFLYQSRLLDDRNAVVRLLKIMEKDLLLAFHVMSFVFDLDINPGDKTDSVLKTFLYGFMWSFVAGNISSPASNLYVLTRKYWEDLSEGLRKYCLDHEINIKQFSEVRKNMFLCNSGHPKESPFMWYPEIVLRDLRNLSEAFHGLPSSRFSETCSKLNHLLDIFDLKTKNLWLSHQPSTEDLNFLYVSAMLNGFAPLVAQINDAPFISPVPVSQKGSYTLPCVKRNPLIVNPVFCMADKSIQYKTCSKRVRHIPASGDGRYEYDAYEEVVYDLLIKLPFDQWWSCTNFSPWQNDYEMKSEESHIYVGLPEICFGNIPNAQGIEGSNFLKIHPNSKMSNEDLKSVSHIAYCGDLLSLRSKRCSLISNVHTAIPQAKLLISKLIDNQAICSIPDVRKYVDKVIHEYLMRAAVNKQYSLVTFMAAYQKSPQDMDRLAQQLCVDERTRDAGMMLKKELPILSSMEWWFALSQVADTVPKEVKEHIFGFFRAICAKEQQAEALEIEPVVPK